MKVVLRGKDEEIKSLPKDESSSSEDDDDDDDDDSAVLANITLLKKAKK